MSDERKSHWQTVYETKPSNSVSWYRPHLDVSLDLLKLAGLNAKSRVIDVGAGSSTLVDDLLALNIESITALDISSVSLAVAKQRLGERANRVQWLVADVVNHSFAPNSFDIWHDRAVLHFLIDDADAMAYMRTATSAVSAGGYVIIGGFASDGPERCSGLPVRRRDPKDIAALLQSAFTLVDSRKEEHLTPGGNAQSFAYALLRKT